MAEHFRATFPGTRPTIYPNSVILHGIQLKFSMGLCGKYFPYLARLFNRPRTSTHTHTHTHCHQNESSEVREKQCPQPGTALSSFNRIKLIIMQLCFKFNFIGVDVKTLPCLHATCRKYNHNCQWRLFTDSRARTQPRCLPNIPFLPRNGFSYETARQYLQYSHSWI